MNREEFDALIEKSAKTDNTPDSEVGSIAIIDRAPDGLMRIRQRDYGNKLVVTTASTLKECRVKHRAETDKAYPTSGRVDY